MEKPIFDLADFTTDEKKQIEGVWVDFGGEARFKIASFRNPDFQKAFASMREPYDKLRKTMTDAEMKSIMVFCLARYVVLGWENVFDNKQPLPYSIEAAERVLDKLDAIRDRVIEEATKIANFKAESNKEVAGN